MTLRCKPGDLAEILVASPYNPAVKGRLVDVLSLAPAGDFAMPDGNLQFAVAPDYWVCRLVGGPVLSPIGPARGRYSTMHRRPYIAVPDRFLRPIRPDAEPIDVERGEPVEITA
jgi:hypothetical protein